MDEIKEFISYSIQIQSELILSLVIITGLGLIKWVLNKLINNRIKDLAVSYRWRKFTTYFIFFIGFLLILLVWFKEMQSLATFFGLFTAGLAITLRDPLANLVGWIFIIWKRPFSIGDRIEIDGTAGDVIDIRIFQFSLIEIGEWVDADQSTGRVVHISNNRVLNSKIANYTAGFSFVWHEIPVLITLESNWEEAKEILLDIAYNYSGHLQEKAREKIQHASKKFLIYYGKLTPIVYTRVKESGIQLTIRYLCEPQNRRTSEGHIWEEILHKFSEREDIDFAYPTQRLYFKERHSEERNLEDNEIQRHGFKEGESE